MTIDWSISLGNILTILGFAGSGVVFVLMMRSDILVLANRVTNVEAALRIVAESNLTMARTEEKTQAIDERVNLISRRLDDYINRTYRDN